MTEVARVLVVEDDPVTADTLRRYLERDGHRVELAADGPSALDVARRTRPQVVLLDVMLPGLDGLEVCRRLTKEFDLSVLMVSARVTEADFVAGLDAGADDYVGKPFRPREVMARVRAALRRHAPARDGVRSVASRGIVVDVSAHRATVDGEEVALTPTEFALLAVLVAQPDRVFTRSDLIADALGHGHDAFERTIDTHVLNLRRKVDPRRDRIETVFGVGYRFVGDPT